MVMSPISLPATLYNWYAALPGSIEYGEVVSSLHAQLFKNYNALYRPQQLTDVNITMSLASVVDVVSSPSHACAFIVK